MTSASRPARSFAPPRRTLLAILPALAWAAWARPAHAESAVRTEAVEAAYLHKLPGFVEWPADAFASPSSPIVIGVMGAPAVVEELVRIAKGRLVLGRPVEARLVASIAEASRDLHVLFVGSGPGRDLGKLADASRGRHALVVTDSENGVEDGAAIVFVQVDGRLRFEVSLPGARKAGLKLSSQLMGVAWKVVGDAS